MRSTCAELLQATAAGDEAAFSRLYDETAPRVHGLVLRIVRDPAQSDEVTQETYLDIWRTAGRFDAARGSAVSWLMTLAHRKAVDRVRSTAASTRRDTVEFRQEQREPSDQTADTVHAASRDRAVRDALLELTPEQRQAIELSYFGGHTHLEVSRLLEIPLGTAKSRIRSGLLRLREDLVDGGLETA